MKCKQLPQLETAGKHVLECTSECAMRACALTFLLPVSGCLLCCALDAVQAGPAGAAQAGAADGGASNSGGSSESGSDSEAGEGSGSRGAGASGAGGGGGGGGAGARAAKAEEAWDLSKSRLFMQRAHDNGGDCFDSEQVG